MVKKLKSLELDLEPLNEKEKELSKKITSFKKSLTVLQNIESQIRFQGIEFIKINIDANECPLCKAKYKNSIELKKRIKATNTRLTSSNILTDLISEKESITLTVNQIKSHITNLKELKTIIKKLGNLPNAIDQPLAKLLTDLSKHFMQLKSYRNRLEELQFRKEKYLSKGIDEIQFNQLKQELIIQTEYGTIKSKLELEKIISKLQQQIIDSKKDLADSKETVNIIENKFELLLKEYDDSIDKSNYKNSLEIRKSNIEHYIHELESEKYVLRITKSDDIRTLFKKISKLEQLLNKVREEKKHKMNTDIISTKANDTITANKLKIKKITDENNRLFSALNVFNNISENHNEEKHFENFINDNKEEIQRIFLAIHSPHEFTNLSIESGKIMLTRDNLEKDGIQNISAGQRSALAISVFLALNNKLKNGPNLLMFDDPVSFTDDLNILSFIDYLRQIAFDKPDRQIFFATANENLAFLFRKKFEILGDDFKRILLKR